MVNKTRFFLIKLEKDEQVDYNKLVAQPKFNA